MVLVFSLSSWINLQKLMSKAQKKILRYVHGTTKHKIANQKREDAVVLGESDADCSGDRND